MEQIQRLSVRVYGLLIDSHKRVLVSDEFIRGSYFTKFPGGGLEFGEGTRDCLKREFMEETGLIVEIGAHIYTTDFFQRSAFNERDQIMSIYYFVHAAEPINLATHDTVFAFAPEQIANKDGTAEVFRWIPWDEFTAETVTLPIDKIVAEMIVSGQISLP